MKPVIAIDGPAASGKGTLGRMLAEHLHFQHLDSGILYRTFACFELILADHPEAVLDDKLDSDSIPNACGDYDLLKDVSTLNPEKRWQNIFVGWSEHKDSVLSSVPAAHELINFVKNIPENVLKSEIVGRGASTLAKLPEVRDLMNKIMREFAANPGKDAHGVEYDGIVIDGRDIGTVVFPNATCKVFVTADLKVRAERRLAQEQEAKPRQQQQGCPVTFDSIYEALKSRDERDKNRENAPLRCDETYSVLDTSNVGIEEAFELLKKIVASRITA